MRRRIQSKKDITEKTESKEPENERDTPAVQKRDQNPQQDPIKWFGILVPQSLKQAQSSFKQGTMLLLRVYFVGFRDDPMICYIIPCDITETDFCSFFLLVVYEPFNNLFS